MEFKVLDNNGKSYEISAYNDDLIVKKEDISTDTEYIDFVSQSFDATVGDEGYYVISDADSRGSYLCRFTEQADCEFDIKQNLMPIFGVKKKNECFFGIVKGLQQNFHIVIGVKGGKYYLKLRFYITEFGGYEDIRICIVQIDESADYSEMATLYREYQLKNGACVPLKERIKNSPELEYAVHAPEIRIRMGWKPAPPKVLEQTPETEPEMFVACTFERVKDLIDEMKAQGVEKAQLCLVGWNKSGHDGRYPQMFPVEERLGGKQGLRDLICYAQKNGYQIVCHTNSTDCYSIADTFSKDIVAKKPDGGLSMNNIAWSGGNMYHLCPAVALDYAKKDLPKVAELGFKGLHYVDVMSVAPLRECYDEKHPCTKTQTLEYYEKIMELSHKEFGGYASEGAFDFMAKHLDYALYVTWSSLDDGMFDNIFDEEIPLWQMVYHGIVLSNPSTTTVNYTIKGKDAVRRLNEFGGRPSFYIYSKHMQGGKNDDWLGNDDLILNTDEQLKYAVSKIKEGYDEYKKTSFMQLEYMVSHKKTENGFEIEYSDGTVVKG